MSIFVAPARPSGRIVAPPSKSILIRAVVCATLCRSQTEIRFRGSLCSDVLDALSFARAFGARADVSDSRIAIRPARRPPARLRVDLRDSATLLRLALPIVALMRIPAVVSCSPRLFARVASEAETLEFAPDRARHSFAFSGSRPDFDQSALGASSSQLLSGLLLARAAIGDSAATPCPDVSRPYFALTAKTLRDFGVELEQTERGLSARSPLASPGRFDVSGDWSCAAFMLVAGALGGPVEVDGLSFADGQGDIAIANVLRNCGAEITATATGLVSRRGSPSRIAFDATDAPDLFPPISVLAALTPGEHVVTGIGRQRAKESDRPKELVGLLDCFGARAVLSDDSVRIFGKASLGASRAPALPDDHRVCMAAILLSLFSRTGAVISRESSVDKSYPGFLGDIRSLIGGERCLRSET